MKVYPVKRLWSICVSGRPGWVFMLHQHVESPFYLPVCVCKVEPSSTVKLLSCGDCGCCHRVDVKQKPASTSLSFCCPQRPAISLMIRRLEWICKSCRTYV